MWLPWDQWNVLVVTIWDDASNEKGCPNSILHAKERKVLIFSLSYKPWKGESVCRLNGKSLAGLFSEGKGES